MTKFNYAKFIIHIEYWRGLSSDEDFAGYTLKSYLSAIHTDIVDVWNFPDKDGVCLSFLLNCFVCLRRAVLVV